MNTYIYIYIYIFLLIFCAGRTEHKGLTCSAGTASSGTAWPVASSYHPLLLQPALHQTKQPVNVAAASRQTADLLNLDTVLFHTYTGMQYMTASHSSYKNVSTCL